MHRKMVKGREGGRVSPGDCAGFVVVVGFNAEIIPALG